VLSFVCHLLNLYKRRCEHSFTLFAMKITSAVWTQLQKMISLMLIVGASYLVFAQKPSAGSESSPPDGLKHYALVFYKNSSYAPDQQRQSRGDLQAFVKRITDSGIKLDPRSLHVPLAIFSGNKDGVVSRETPDSTTLTTILFFDAPGPDRAIEIARTHPGMRYGVDVEVREWTAPAL
jgi:hypothetical protein